MDAMPHTTAKISLAMKRSFLCLTAKLSFSELELAVA